MRPVVVLALSLAACQEQVPPSAMPVRPGRPVPNAVQTPDAGASSGSSESLVALADAGEPDTDTPPAHLRALSKISDDLAGRTMGYSADGRYLGYCISTCDPCPTDCRFDERGTHKSISATAYSWPPNGPKVSEAEEERRRKQHEARFDKFLADLAVPGLSASRVARGPWPYADVSLVDRQTRADDRGTVTVELGGHIDGEPDVFVVRIDLGPHPAFNSPLPKSELPNLAGLTPAQQREATAKAIAKWRENFLMGDAELAFVDVSSDGSELGVVGFAHGSMWYEAAAVRRMPLTEFVARVYEGAAKSAAQGGRAKRAEELSAKAVSSRRKP